MSSNFFSALDDSGDEAPQKSKPIANKKESKAPKKDTKEVADVQASERRRPNNNDRNTKHGRGGRAPARDGKRAYDRRSGTGRGKEIKKDGGGSRNWGNDKAEAKKMEGKIGEETAVEKEGEEKPTNETTVEEESPVEETPEEPEPEPEPVDNTISYADYMASKAKKDEKAAREVENEFKGKAAAVKVEESFLVLGGGKQKKKKAQKGEKKSIEVGFRVANPNAPDVGERGRGGRGRGEGRFGRGDGEGRGGRGGRGRGEGRGGRGRGEGRGGRGRGESRGGGRGRGPRNPVINVLDESAFPSL